MGGCDTRPDYDYTEGSRCTLYRLGGGCAEAVIPDLQGRAGADRVLSAGRP